MKNGTWRASPLAVVSALVIAAAAVLGFFLAKHSVESQNQALLKEDATQAAGYVSSLISTLGSTLEPSPPGSRRPMAHQPLSRPRPKRWRAGHSRSSWPSKSGAQFVATAVAGTGFKTGEVLDAPAVRRVGQGGLELSCPGPCHYDGKTSTFGLAPGPALGPGRLRHLRAGHARPLRRHDGHPGGTVPCAPGCGLRHTQKPDSESAGPGQHPCACRLTGATFEAPRGRGLGHLVAGGRGQEPAGGTVPECGAIRRARLRPAAGARRRQRDRGRRCAASAMRMPSSTQRTAELLASQEALVRSERLSAVGQMTTVVGHELRNPLGAVMNALYMLRRSLGDPDAAEPHLAVAERQTARAVNLAQDLTAYMREREPELAPMGLREVLSDVLEATPKPDNVVVVEDVGRSRAERRLRADRADPHESRGQRLSGHAQWRVVCASRRAPRGHRRSSPSRTVARESTRTSSSGSSSPSSRRGRKGPAWAGHRAAPHRGPRRADLDRERAVGWRHRHRASPHRAVPGSWHGDRHQTARVRRLRPSGRDAGATTPAAIGQRCLRRCQRAMSVPADTNSDVGARPIRPTRVQWLVMPRTTS